MRLPRQSRTRPRWSMRLPRQSSSSTFRALTSNRSSPARRRTWKLTSANQVAFQGLQAVAKRQAEILQEMMNEASTAVVSLSKAGSPPEIVARSTELAKGAFEHALANMKQLAELVTKASEEVTNTINTRILASLDEIKDMALKVKQEEKKG